MQTRRKDKGMVLLLVLAVVALLTSLLTEVAFSTLVDLRLTETFRDSTRAYYLARGGVAAGRMILQEDRNDYDAPSESWYQGVASYPVGEGSVSITIRDLDGRLAINELVDGNNPQPLMVDRFYRLFAALDIDHLADPAELTAALIDWLDSGDDAYREIRTDGLNLPVSGAEQAYYQGQQTNYPCKNAPLETLEELLLIKGFSEELLAILRPHLAVNGRRQVNINTASDMVLLSLAPEVDEQVVNMILTRRREAPFVTIAALESLLPAAAYSALKSLANQRALGTTSSVYQVTSHARVNDGSRIVWAEVDKPDNQLLFIKVD